ncbi:cutinase-domain-containing protein [Dendrothele bispora CBS 962.96]|uniref:cutinase n=1 Tax=Dendrothele bispora (strain CBS 962.96) TaxID=1314807 RepID=A0A4V4HI96_DENBC|nr:cutinase-domain-containing protein [Dendrothele bispora CBS 962.96]
MFKSLLTFVTIAGLAVSGLAAPVIEARQSCADVIVVYARGTGQSGTIGDPQSVGALLQADLASALGSRSLSFRGVDYPASIAGFLEGGATDLTSAANSCPNSKIVSAGYSQGGQLVHNSAAMLSTAVKNRISAVVIFGDPKRDQPISGIPSNRIDIICHTGDNICDGGIIVAAPHLCVNLRSANMFSNSFLVTFPRNSLNTTKSIGTINKTLQLLLSSSFRTCRVEPRSTRKVGLSTSTTKKQNFHCCNILVRIPCTYIIMYLWQFLSRKVVFWIDVSI